MTHYYSISGFSTTSFEYEHPLIFVGEGMNVFTVLTDDVDSLVERLRLDGLRIEAVNQLDDYSTNQTFGDESPGVIPPILTSGTI